MTENKVVLRLVLVCMLVVLFGGIAKAERSVDSGELLFSDGLPAEWLPLLTKEPSALDLQDRHALVRLLINRDLAASARYVLDQTPKDDAADATSDLTSEALRAHLAVLSGDVGNAQTDIAALLVALASRTDIDRISLESDLVAVLKRLRALGAYGELFRLLSDAANAHPDWAGLEVEALLWSRVFSGLVAADKKAAERLNVCATVDDCLAWTGYASETSNGSGLYFAALRAWRLAHDAADIERVLRATLALGLEQMSDSVLSDWLHHSPVPASLAELLDDRPDLVNAHIDDLKAMAVDWKAVDRWRMARVAFAIGDRAWLKALILQEKENLSGAEELIEALRTLALLSRELKAAKAKACSDRLGQLLQRAERMKVEPQTAAQIVLLRMPKLEGAALASFVALAKQANEAKTQIATLTAALGLLRNEQEKAIGMLSERLFDPENADLWRAELLFSVLADQSLKSKMELRGQALQILHQASAPTQMIIRFRIAKLADDRGEMRNVIVQAAQPDFDIWTRLLIAREALDLRMRSEAQAILLTLEPTLGPDEARFAIRLWFDLNAHERALALVYQLEGTKAVDSLRLARLLSADYRAWLARLTSAPRHTRISIDIYTQQVLRSLNRHLVKRDASALFAECVAIMQAMQIMPRIDDLSQDVGLRLAMHEIRRDLDASVFDAYKRFTDSAPQPLEVWIDLALLFAQNTNSDFFAVLWQQAQTAILSESQLSALATSLRTRPDNQLVAQRRQVEARLREMTVNQGEAASLMKFAWWMTAVSYKVRDDTAQARKVLNESLALLKIAIGGLEDRLLDDRYVMPSLENNQDITIEMTSLDSERDLSSAAIRDGLVKRQWLIEDCLRTITPAESYPPANLSIWTDVDGLVVETMISGLTGAGKKEEFCIAQRLKSLRIDDVDTPFGYARFKLELSGSPPTGYTEADRKLFREKLNAQQAEYRLTEKRVKNRLDDMAGEEASIKDFVDTLVSDSVAWSYDPVIYREAAIWFERVLEQPKAGAVLRGQARWVWLWPWLFGLFGLGVFVAIGWRIRTVHRREKTTRVI
jgi:hypothetical protein